MAKKKTKPSVLIPNDELLKRREIFDSVKMIIKYAAIILGILFSWLQFKEIPAPEISDKISSSFLRITLILTYTSWIYGTVIDLNDEEYIFIIAPNNGKLTKNSIGMIALPILIFALLCYCATSLKLFTFVLTLFSVSGKAGEVYFGKFVRHSIERSKIKYKEANDYIGLLSIAEIERYIMGKWFWHRFFVGSFILVIVNLFAFTNLSAILAGKLNIQSSSFITVCAIFIYLFVMEIWIWLKRVKRKLYLKFLSDLNRNYVLIADEKGENEHAAAPWAAE